MGTTSDNRNAPGEDALDEGVARLGGIAAVIPTQPRPQFPCDHAATRSPRHHRVHPSCALDWVRSKVVLFWLRETQPRFNRKMKKNVLPYFLAL